MTQRTRVCLAIVIVSLVAIICAQWGIARLYEDLWTDAVNYIVELRNEKSAIEGQNADLRKENAALKTRLPDGDVPGFWRRIADDPACPKQHRRAAAFLLFKEYAPVGASLRHLAQVLGRPRWLRGGDIDKVTMLAGKIPVELNHWDAVFVIRILPESGQDVSAVYLRIAGDVSEEEMRRLLLGGNDSTAVDREILEIALCP